jgi:hypothetical protein
MDGRRWKRAAGVASLALLLGGALGLVLLSNPMVDVYLSWADRDPDGSKALLLRVGALCDATARPHRSVEAYRRYFDRYPGDEQRPFALLRLAQALERDHRIAESVDLYRKFTIEYPLSPHLDEARLGLRRLDPGP